MCIIIPLKKVFNTNINSIIIRNIVKHNKLLTINEWTIKSLK